MAIWAVEAALLIGVATVLAFAWRQVDTLPHNGAVITPLAVSGLTHREAYADIFAITCFKTIAVFAVISVYLLFGTY